MGIAVTVVFTGLCALVTGGDRAPGQVLLVDAKGLGEIGGVELPDHAPTLVVSLSSLANAETSRPDRVLTAWPGNSSLAGVAAIAADQIGVWDLTGSEVRIRVQGDDRTGVDLSSPSGRESSWPEPPRDANDPEAWRDLRFVADMRALAGDGRIDPSLIAGIEADGQKLPRALAARFHLSGGRLDAAIPSQATYRDEVFEFRAAGSAPRLRQALTDTLSWTFESDAPAVVIEIIPVAGGPARRLVLAGSTLPHRVFVSNLPAANTHGHAHTSQTEAQLAALHFGIYYELLKVKPSVRPLPLPWMTRPRPATGVMGPFLPSRVVRPRLERLRRAEGTSRVRLWQDSHAALRDPRGCCIRVGREACQERTLSLRYSPQAGSYWCWAASGQMVMELLGVEQSEACQCRQAEQVLGVAGCCATPGSCVPAGDVGLALRRGALAGVRGEAGPLRIRVPDDVRRAAEEAGRRGV